ncbi:REP-associated tyrosine transposase [Marinobacterium litorale]|uniref:REP-associated tyrosine transposase n=1 Tax=Marinobacterium litorale TaxID=404770 RepID=UPI000419ED72|nr:transposase [Marinobacterium litorale]
MVNYRRNYVPGGTCFFTVTLKDRGSNTLIDHIEALRDAHRAVLKKSPFVIDASVILPDHLHAIWRLPEDDADYSKRWQSIKADFSRRLSRSGKRGRRGLWQPRFWEYTITSENDLNIHRDYIHLNPVKHGLTDSPANWAYSSFWRFVNAGFYTPDWGESEYDLSGNFGE